MNKVVAPTKCGGGSNRINEISLIRLLATCAIVACHIMQYYNMELAWWFNVGVQIFLVMSGFLYSFKEVEDPVHFMSKQGKKILIPFFVYIWFIIILFLCFRPGELTLVNTIKSILGLSTIQGLNHLWFIPYILLCYLFTPYLHSIRRQLMQRKAAGIFMRQMLVLSFIVIYGTFYTDFKIYYIVCYIVGYFVGCLYEKYGKKVLRIGAIIALACATIVNILRIYINYFTEYCFDGTFEKIYELFEGYAHAALGISLFLVMFWGFSKIKLHYNKIFEVSDKLSFYVYITHHLFILSSFNVMEVTLSRFLNILIVLLLTMISAAALYKITTSDWRFVTK
ncbi:MAG: acyltransferase family protein [Suipraeoptans sp.]